MAKYQKYAEYQDSGVEWLGEIPSCWKAIRLKHLILDNLVYGANEAAEDDNPNNPRYIRITDMNSDGSLDPNTFRSLPYHIAQSYLLQEGDILLARSGATVGKSFLFKSEFGTSCFAGYLIRARSNKSKLNPKFAYWFFQSESYWKYVSGSQIQATIQNVSAEKYGDLYLSVPEIQDQGQIANFLDHETTKIDILIAKQEKLIELLKEKRQAVISHAVTKGLNPNVPMKDSGVEWLGGVPEHWTVIKLKHLTTLFEQGWSPQCDSRTAEPHEYGILKVGCVNGGKFRALENKALPSELEPRLQYLIQKNDLLISRANTKELVGSAAVIDEDYPNLILCDKLYRLRFTRAVSAEMVALYLSIGVVREQIELSTTGASHSMQNIGQDTIKELFYLLPPIDEAHNILKDIAKSNTKFDSLISKAESAIQLMQERRATLISAAVTGKIDVRNWQHPNQKNNNHTELSA